MNTLSVGASILVTCVLLPVVIVVYLFFVFVDPEPFSLLCFGIDQDDGSHRALVTARLAVQESGKLC